MSFLWFLVKCLNQGLYSVRSLYLQGLVYFVVNTCSYLHSSTNVQALPRDVARKK